MVFELSALYSLKHMFSNSKNGTIKKGSPNGDQDHRRTGKYATILIAFKGSSPPLSLNSGCNWKFVYVETIEDMVSRGQVPCHGSRRVGKRKGFKRDQ